jgi:hypothetical protein
MTTQRSLATLTVTAAIAALAACGGHDAPSDSPIASRGQALDRVTLVDGPITAPVEEAVAGAWEPPLAAPPESAEPALPELMVTDLALPGPAATSGQSATWKVTIANVSATAATQPFTVVLASGGQPFFVQSVGGLAGNATLTLSTTTASSPVGSEVITATVDYTDAILEISEQLGTAGPDANTLHRTLVTGQVSLALTKLALALNAHGAIKAQDKLAISFEVTNQGTATASGPFYVSVYPGKLAPGGAIAPEVIKVSQTLAPGAKITLRHEVRLFTPGPDQATVSLDVSLTKPDFLYKGGIAAGAAARTRAFEVWGMVGGRLYDTRSSGITAAEMKAYVQADPELPWYRKEVARVALEEMTPKICGEAARERYDASGLWCSEFARWVLLQAGMEDERYSRWSLSTLSDITVTADLVAFFDNRGLFTWAGSVTPQTAMPGDFLSMTTYGKKKNHSAIVTGVSHDHKWLWIAQGNAGDCTHFERQAYFAGSTLDAALDGFGRPAPGLFGNISSMSIP